jgi:ATP-dependent RNA helicase DeaD
MVRLFVPAGRALRITPGDLVGAIANEVGISGRVIGAIHIDERHATVEVPREIADQVVTALRATTIKGKRLNVRRDRGSSA